MKKTLTPDELRKLRESLGLSQDFMAAKTGMAQPNYWRIEHGVQPPKGNQMWEFEEILNKERAKQIVATGVLDTAPTTQKIVIEQKSPLDWITPGSALLIVLIGMATLAPDFDRGLLEILGAKSFSEVNIGYPALFITLAFLAITMWLFVITVNGICSLITRMTRSIRSAIVNSRPVVYLKTGVNHLKNKFKQQT